MVSHLYPDSTLTTPEVACAALDEALKSVDEGEELHSIAQTLAAAARMVSQASDPDWPKSKALWLVAAACSMRLVATSTSEPFQPMLLMADGNRSPVASDFSHEDALLLSQIAQSTSRTAVKARLSDVAWVCARPKDVADALRAVDVYVSAPPTEENWLDLQTDWERAITLCNQLRAAAGDRLERIEATLRSIAIGSIPNGDSLGLAAARILLQRRMARASADEIAELLAVQGASLLTGGDYYGARDYLGLAGDWFSLSKNMERLADVLKANGLSWEAEADRRVGADPGGGQIAGSIFLESAIQTLRKIPKAQRGTRGIDEELDRLLRRLPDAGIQALKAMTTISTDPIDVSDFVRRAENAVAGKEPLMALWNFVNLHGGFRVERLIADAKENMRRFPLSTMFAASVYSTDGRVIAKTPEKRFGRTPEDSDPALFANLLRNLSREIDFICTAQIIPALLAIRNEHTLTRAALEVVFDASPIIPPGRSKQFAKGIFEGFELDFATAIYVLAPQVEHLVRWQLKSAGVVTTVVDKEGIENESGLSTLVDKCEVEKIFGEDLTFELKALFCSSFGPNLRNEVAHGLLGADESQTTAIVYAWWWVLKLVLRSFSAAKQPATYASGQTILNLA